MAVEFYLVSAARRAHRLREGRSYVFGREVGCDIHVQDALASRRHAEVRWQDEAWTLVDLESRNGVMLNSVRITRPCKLEDGDQVAIGGQIFRFHVLPSGADPASLSEQAPQISTAETMGPGFNLADLATQGAAFTGQLTDGLFEMLQYLLQTRKTGRLDLIGPGAMGSVWVTQGAPCHASYATRTGMEALVDLVQNPPQRFAFHADQTPESTTLEGSANGILMEVARMVDEAKRSS
jgi:pSer/pThr/pTyr-binding forkhead associated (FHA) protein